MRYIQFGFLLLLTLFLLCSCNKSDETNNEYYSKPRSLYETVKETVYKIDGQKVSAKSFEAEIPADYGVNENGDLLIIKNMSAAENYSISTEEHIYSDDSFDEYLSGRINGYKSIDARVSDPEKIAIDDNVFQRIKIYCKPLNVYEYIADLGDKAFVITLDTGNIELSSDEADSLIDKMNISFP